MSENVTAVAARRVFDGAAVRPDAAVLLDGGSIAAVVPRGDVDRTIATHDLPDGAWLAPGFIDVQVNGGGDVLFNDDPTPDALRAILAAHRKFGTTAMLPTLISDTAEKMAAAIAAANALAESEPGVLGIHLEGPFLSPEKPGVHDVRLLRRPTADDLALLTSPHRGVRLVTLAPEQVPASFVAALAAAGVKVALGHSAATFAQTQAAMDEGLTGFTHLFNAMRPLASREPGPIAAALLAPQAFYGLIADGVHVAPAMLQLALRGAGRALLVTDAMPPVGGTRSSFVLAGKTVTVRDGRCATADGTLAGSCLDMAGAVRNSVKLLGLPLADAFRLATANPAEFLGLGARLGRLAPGFRADMVAIDATTFAVLETWVAGRSSETPASTVLTR